MFTIEETTVECVKDPLEIKKADGTVVGHKVFCKDIAQREWSTFITLVAFDADLATMLAGRKEGDHIRVASARLKSRTYKQAKKTRSAYELLLLEGEPLD